MRFLKSISVICLFAFLATTATAQWIYQEHGSVFEATGTHLALVVSGIYGAGLRCTNSNDLTFIFITPERVDNNNDDTLQFLNSVSPELLIRVDDNDIITLSAQADETELGLSLFAASPVSLAEQVIAARSRISVAARVLGQLFHEQSFSVGGSTASVSRIKELCNF